MIMECVVDPLGKGLTDPRCCGNILDARSRQLPQSSETFQKRLPPLGADAGNLLKNGCSPPAFAPLPVGRDGKTVGLVSDLLYQMESR